MVLKIAIVDDVETDAQALAELSRTFFTAQGTAHVAEICMFHSAEEFLSQPGWAEYFLVFLDIRMGGASGIDAARRLRAQSISTLIVFVTSSPEYVWDAMPVHPFDYLIKPATPDTAGRVLKEALRTLGEPEQLIDIRIAYGTVTVPAGHISAIVSRDHALQVTLTTGEQVRSIQTFAQLTEKLAEDRRFLLCNRGVLINMDETVQFTGDSFLLRDGTRFPVRQRDKSLLAQRFAAHQLNRIRKVTGR